MRTSILMYMKDGMGREKRKFFYFLVSLIVWLVAPRTQAATFELLPASGQLKIAQEFAVDLKINSLTQMINAAQATILFPKRKLEVTKLDKENSIFNFWLDEPTFSNADGTITFIGGNRSGIAGGNLQVFRILFKTKDSGPAIVSLEDAAVTAADGSGTNLLTSIAGAAYDIAIEFFVPRAATTTPPTVATTTVLTPPPAITRTPLPGKNLPTKPKLKIELYPDRSLWYSVSSPFLITWELPPDISGISTALNREINFVPPPISQGLTEGRVMEPLKDGVWYFHARFKNSVGWGDTDHYKIAIDTVPPVAFVLDAPGGATSGNPRPFLKFKTSDALSGIAAYVLYVDNGEPTELILPEHTLPPQPPGRHVVSVRARDRAGNSQEATLALNIVPIPSPTVTFLTPFITIGSEDRFTVKGIGVSSTIIHVAISDRKDQMIIHETTAVGGNGDWVFTPQEDLRRGEYSVTVWAEDKRGALSLKVHAGGVVVKEKAALSIGAFEFTAPQLLLTLFLFGLFGGVTVLYFFELRKQKHLLRYGIVEYDFHKMVNLLEKDISELEQKLKSVSDGEQLRQESDYLVSSLSLTIKKIKNYFMKEVGKLKE